MEGETYGSITRASESGLSERIVRASESGVNERISVEFLHGRRTEEGLYRIVIERRVTRTKYLIKDVTGKGLLNLEGIPIDTISCIVKKEETSKGAQFMVVGCLSTVDRKEFPILDAISISVFSYERALNILSK